MRSDLLEEFSAGLFAFARESLPEEVVHESRRCLLNVLGTSLGASRSKEIDALAAAGCRLGTEEMSVLGRKERLDRFFGATVVGFAAHFDDFDDTHLETVIHPGAATLGALYVLSLSRDISSSQTLVAMALGVEAQLRVGLAMTPSHYDLGWHITGTCGVVGAAVASAIAMELSKEELASAIAISMTMTLGQREAFGTPIKPYHAGKAASNGLLAAMLASSGVLAPTDIMAGEHGYFEVLSDEWSPKWLERTDLGARWAILDTTYKPYPCGIVAHPAIEAATLLHSRRYEPGAFAVDGDLDRVEVACNPLVVELMGRTSASTGLEARFCAIHGVAVGLLTGRAGLAEFSDEMAVDDRVRALRSKTTLVADGQHSRQAATVTVYGRDGSVMTEHVSSAAGSLERPLSDDQLSAKFSALVEPRFPGRSVELAAAAMAIGEGPTIKDLDRLVSTR